MNQRFFLALLLTAVVVMLTPVLFPGRPRPPVTQTANSPPPAQPAAVRPPGAAAPLPAADTSAIVGDSAPAVRADTVAVATRNARLRLSALGGALIGTELTNYHSLGGDSSAVELARPDESLLRFRIVVGADTIPLDHMPLEVTEDSARATVDFRGVARGVPVAVRWSFAPDTYHVRINRRDEPVGFVHRVTVEANGVGPGAFLVVDLPRGFRSSEADSATDFQHLAYAYKPVNGGADLIRFGKLDPGERRLRPGAHQWAVAKSKYFLVGILARSENEAFAELQVIGMPRTWKMHTSGQATVVVPMQLGRADLEVYAGPQEWRRLLAMGREFESANPYGGFMQGMIQPFATIVMRVLLWMKDVLQLNYGWTLIIFGILVRVVLWPLNQTAMRASLRMQRIQPELSAAQKKYASNPQKQRDEIMRIYKEHGMSPFSALSGCLPMLIPMPVLFALFFVFQNTIEFRGVSFWWMADISQKDPFYILPVVMAASMFVLSWIGMRNAPPNPQAKLMLYFLPGMMLVILFNFAAGLNLYYAAQNLAALPQQWLIANERAKLAKPSG